MDNRRALHFLVKSLAFSVIFSIIWVLIEATARAAFQEPPAADPGAAQNASRLNAYDQQMARAQRQMDRAEAYQQRMEAWLSTQEAQSARYEKVLQAWEKQAGVRK